MLFWNEQGLLREGYETDIQKLKRNCLNLMLGMDGQQDVSLF